MSDWVLNRPTELQWHHILASTHFCMYVTDFPSYARLFLNELMNFLNGSHITGKPVTDAIKHADVQLHLIFLKPNSRGTDVNIYAEK